MTVRQLINVSYAYLSQNKDEDELRKLNRVLEKPVVTDEDAARAARPANRGMPELMATLGAVGMGPPPRRSLEE